MTEPKPWQQMTDAERYVHLANMRQMDPRKVDRAGMKAFRQALAAKRGVSRNAGTASTPAEIPAIAGQRNMAVEVTTGI